MNDLDFKEKFLEEKQLRIKIQNKYNVLKKEHQELERKYINLRCRYTSQNNELLQLKILLSKEVGHEERD